MLILMHANIHGIQYWSHDLSVCCNKCRESCGTGKEKIRDLTTS